MQGKRVGIKEFISRSRELYGDRFDYSRVEYNKLLDNITINCNLHGTTFSVQGRKHLEGRSGCHLCGRSRKLTIEHVADELQQLGIENIDLQEASIARRGAHPWIEGFSCSLHGGSLSYSHHSLLQGFTPCVPCGKEVTVQRFITRSREQRGESSLDYSLVTADSLKRGVVEFLCNRHGVLYSQELKAHSRGTQGCPICSSGPMGRYFDLQEQLLLSPLPDNILPGSIHFAPGSSIMLEMECREHGVHRQHYSRFMEGKQGCRACRGAGGAKGILRDMFLELFPGEVEENTSLSRIGLIHFNLPSRGIAFHVVSERKMASSTLPPLERQGRSIARAEESGVDLYLLSAKEIMSSPEALWEELHALKSDPKHCGSLQLMKEHALIAWRAFLSSVKLSEVKSLGLNLQGPEKGFHRPPGAFREKPQLYPPGKERFRAGVNDLATMNPPWLNEWSDERDPSEVFHRSGVYFTFACSEEHEYKRSPRERYLGMGCPECPTDWSQRGKITLGEKFPELAKELLDPSMGSTLTPSAHVPVQWCCTTHEWNHHAYSLSPNQRVYGRGCPHCAFKEPLAGFNDIAGVMPSLLDELVEEKHGELLANSKGKITWRHCSAEGVEHRWEASPHARIYEGTGCLICSGKQVDSSNNFQEKFLATSPYLWSDENEFLPGEITARSSKRVVLICPLHLSPNVMTDKAKNFASGRRTCQECVPTSYTSAKEADMAECIRKKFPALSIETSVRRYRSQGIHEIDVLIEGDIAVEFNGEYWHQEGVFKPLGYHEEKRRILSSLGISLYEMWESDWDSNEDAARKSLVEYIQEKIDARRR